MDIEAHFRSLTAEMISLKDRVRHFMPDPHWLTDGEWKESVLRNVLSRALPSNVKVGRGFIVTPSRTSTQIDVLLYRDDVPVLFRDGSLVFVDPQSVQAVIEVKTRVDSVTELSKHMEKLVDIGNVLGYHSGRALLGLYAYETTLESCSGVLKQIEILRKDSGRFINPLCLGDSQLVKFWFSDPASGNGFYYKWHSYQLDGVAPACFVHSLVLHVSALEEEAQKLWLPTDFIERHKDGELQAAIIDSR